ncbi:single-stranded DNA-binding protein [Agromyces sp. NPDC127015]|uniref:single-stranded DNA-binding protein n=1 Tax=Agromyces sp. NPDC127015 TaxID=3347108 RepID=UPI00364BBFC9
MAGETSLTVVGNLTADPELRYLPNGTPVVNFTIASTERVFDRQSNEWKDGSVLFMRCSCWREFAEQVAGSLQKGMRVVATGRLRQRQWEDNEGKKGSSTELDVEDVGPSLRYATATVTRAQRRNAGPGEQRFAPASNDAWGATPPPPGGYDETPF